MRLLLNSNFKIGVHGGLPLGDSKEAVTSNVGLDLSYVWEVAPHFELGVTTGYTAYFLKKIPYTFLGHSGVFKQDPISLIPLAANSQYNFDDKFFIGLDLGYGFVVNENKKGGFLYQPKAGVRIAKKHDVFASYTGIAVKGGTVQTVNLGYAFSFKK